MALQRQKSRGRFYGHDSTLSTRTERVRRSHCLHVPRLSLGVFRRCARMYNNYPIQAVWSLAAQLFLQRTSGVHIKSNKVEYFFRLFMLHKVTLAHVRASTYRAIVTRTRRQIVLCEIERLLPEAAGRNRIFNCPHDTCIYLYRTRTRCEIFSLSPQGTTLSR